MLIHAAHILEWLDTLLLHMINFLYKVIQRTPIHLQLNNFIEWKSSFTSDMLEHKKALASFVNFLKIDDAVQIQYDEMYRYVAMLRATGTAYTSMMQVRIVRSFLTYCHKRGYRCINPKLVKISEKGDIDILKEVGENVRLVPTVMKKPLGRPANVEYIEKVKLLKDSGKLSFRQIARAINKDVSQVHVWYNYPMEKLSKRKLALVEKISPGRVLH